MSLVAGQVIDGKYRILRELGVGGMGAVYEGENTRIHRRVAIKVLHASVAQKADIVQRFEREAQAAGRIGSEHIVEVLDLGNLPGGERFMVMEFLDGESLTSRIKVRGRLSAMETTLILRQLLEGLAAAHAAGIIHRDLKPDNIFLVKSRGQDFVKIVDFGVSKFSSTDESFSMTRTGAVMGTPYYMSPEQARGQQIDQRSDLYSVGVVAYQAVTGRVPFNAETFNELIFKIALETPEPVELVVPGFDPGFAVIIQRAMAREAGHRFQSAAEFAQALDRWQAAASPAAYAALPARPGGPLQGSMAQSGIGGAGLGQSGAGGYGGQVGPGQALGQSGSGLYARPGMQGPQAMGSQPGMQQQGQGYPQGAMQSQGGYPGMQPSLGQSGAGANVVGMNGPMGQSQVGLAVTAQPPKRNGAMIAIVAAMALLGVVGGLFIFLYATKAPAPASVTPATATPTTAAEATATAAATTTSTAVAAVDSAAPTASASATAVASVEPTATAKAVATGTKKTNTGANTAATTAKPPSTGTGGRAIGSDL